MKIKVLQIRLSNPNMIHDQDEINLFFESVLVKKTSCQLISDEKEKYWSIIIFYDHKNSSEPKQSKTDKISFTMDTALTEIEKKIFDAFKIWRQSKANELGLPSYMICSNTELITLVKVKPDSIEGLARIKGFGEQKIAKYGDDIIALLNSF